MFRGHEAARRFLKRFMSPRLFCLRVLGFQGVESKHVGNRVTKRAGGRTTIRVSTVATG